MHLYTPYSVVLVIFPTERECVRAAPNFRSRVMQVALEMTQDLHQLSHPIPILYAKRISLAVSLEIVHCKEYMVNKISKHASLNLV
jgi:hypothetical protein